MKILKNKQIASLIAIILMITIAVSMAFSQPASAALRYYKDLAFVSVAPNTVGNGQNVIIAFWCDKLPPTAQGEYGDRWTFDVNIVKPDGTNASITGIESDPVGSAYTNYTPDTTGTYTIQAIMRQHTIDGGASRGLVSPAGAGWWPGGTPVAGVNPIGVVFESALSMPVTLTVTDQPIPRYQETPLPTDYWTRPIYDANRGWSTFAMGQWLGASELAQYGNNGRYDPYTTGPASSHILWTKPWSNGGIAGGVSTVNGSSPDNSYYSGQSYENYGGPSFVLNGKIYYSRQINPREGWSVVDLYSGETLYWANTTGPVYGIGSGQTSTGSTLIGLPSFGQVLTYDSPNQHGTTSYYWVTQTAGGTYSGGFMGGGYTSPTWDMYDDFSNQYICSIANYTWTDRASDGRIVTEGATGTAAVGTDGSILRYNIVNFGSSTAPNWYLQCWNTSQVIMYPFYQIHEEGSGTNTNWLWRPNFGQIYNGTYGLSANVSLPTLPFQGTSVNAIRQLIPDDQLVIIYAGSNNGTLNIPGSVVGINLKPGSVGQILYSYNFTSPANIGDAYGQNEQFSSKNTAFSNVNIQTGIFWYYDPMTLRYFIYDLSNGNLLWTAPQAQQFQFYGGATAVCYNGQFIDCGGYSGVVRAFDAKTGTFLWNWTAPLVGLDETPYQYSPLSYGFLSGDGQLYLYSSEHSVNNPIRRDAQIWDVNLTSGKLVWMLTCWPSTAPILVDQRLLVVDNHDNQLYCYGKGPSATTVSAPQTVPSLGSSVTITGTVTDQTPSGRRTINDNIDFSLKGTPAIADSSMDAWMEYMFRQRPIPADAKGVPVSLDTIDPNGNFVHIGDTTSDAAGNYGFPYSPAVPGTYQIIATFHGSNSYGPSYGTTYLTVGEAPASTPAPTSAPQSIADMYLVPATVGIIVAIAIATIVIVLALRKRP